MTFSPDVERAKLVIDKVIIYNIFLVVHITPVLWFTSIISVLLFSSEVIAYIAVSLHEVIDLFTCLTQSIVD